ncbi:MAG: polysaccharide deacetylase family protein, partial [Gemmatimonadota bacterium]|nr:polysaccharide deacetylase family protein [Gemmatimonadota bacterium]
VPEWVLRDAIADRFAWQIIGRFFERSIYVHCEMRKGARGWSAWLDGTLLAEGLPDGDAERRTALHDKAGWDVFLHELWEGAARPSRTVVAQVSDVAKSQQGWLTVEASAPFPDIVPKSTPLYLQLLIGGAGTSAVSFTRDIHRLGAESIRKTLTDESGYELCRVAVREGLLGAPLSGATSLRARLAAAADLTPPQLEAINVTPAHIRFAPGWGKALSRALPEGGVAIARHASLPYGSSGSRRATLPSAALKELLQAAEAGGEPTVKVNQPQGKSARRLVYAPELLWSPPTARTLAEDAATAPHEDVHGRHHFEELFARDADPWHYTTPYEREKYERTLKMLPSGEIGNALELACAEGHFTVQLAPRVGRLVAADISEIGLERARTRCADYLNVEFRRLDIVRDPLPSGFELVICSEVLYYAGGLLTLQAVALKLAEAIAPGGHLLVTHANLLVDEPDRTGYDWGFAFGAKVIGETLTRTPLLRHVRELRTPLYRIQLFRRVDGSKTPRPSAQDITETQEVALPEPSVAARIRWNGGNVSPIDTSRPVVTERLPILMYHRVAETVVPGRQRYCVTPAMFEQQLTYLRDAGFRSIRLDEWRDASSARRALPGRAVALTFDNAFADFATYAWPLLQRYGFCATVFVVTGQVGRWNNWDEQAGTAEPLMDWDTIVRLSEAGVEFGAHSVTHRRLVSLPPVDVVRECAGARAAIVRAIGRPVTSIAYPYGEEDEAVRHLAGACGFAMGMSSRPALATVRDPLLALPRVEVTGFDGLREFVAKLGG